MIMLRFYCLFLFLVVVASCSTIEPEDLFNKGTVYYFGLGDVSIDVVKGCDYFEMASKYAYPSALFNYGNCFRTGNGRERDINKALEYYKEASDLGVIDAKIAYAALHFYQVKGKELYAVSILEEVDKSAACENSCSQVNFTLGVAYLFGKGVEKNIEKSIKHFDSPSNSLDLGSLAFLVKIHKTNSNEKKYIFYKNKFEQVSNLLNANYLIDDYVGSICDQVVLQYSDYCHN